MRGLRVAALYGIYPQKLGFCGPQTKSAKKTLLCFLSGKKIPEKKVRKNLKSFKAAYPYYKLIAKSNDILDSFDEKVVKAYWLGNELLEKISTDSLRKMILKDFSGPGLLSKKAVKKIVEKIPANSKPHHSFHVFFVGSITGRVVLQGELLDFCRVGWGKIIKLDLLNNRAKIKYQPLVLDRNYRLAKPREKYISWNKNFLPKLKIGQKISFHWNQVIEVLTKREIENLQKYTQETLDALNSAF